MQQEEKKELTFTLRERAIPEDATLGELIARLNLERLYLRESKQDNYDHPLYWGPEAFPGKRVSAASGGTEGQVVGGA